jgi:hypothetical protein
MMLGLRHPSPLTLTLSRRGRGQKLATEHCLKPHLSNGLCRFAPASYVGATRSPLPLPLWERVRVRGRTAFRIRQTALIKDIPA